MIFVSVFLIIFLIQKPPVRPPAGGTFQGVQNSYYENTTITTFKYAIAFTSGVIQLEDELIIQNGTLNSYKILNSTILNNSIVINPLQLLSINIMNTSQVLMRNLRYPNLYLFVRDTGKLIVENCTFNSIRLTDFGSVILINSTIENVRDFEITFNLAPRLPIQNSANLTILANSTIYAVKLACGTCFQIENSRITAIECGGSNLYKFRSTWGANGHIRSSSILNLRTYDEDFIYISNSEITGTAFIRPLSQCIFENSSINTLLDGKIAYMGVTTINQSGLFGEDCINNTQLKNSNTTIHYCVSIGVNGTAKLQVDNLHFGWSIRGYDFSEIRLNNITTGFLNLDDYMLWDSSLLSMENFTGILANIYMIGPKCQLLMMHSAIYGLHRLGGRQLFALNSSFYVVYTNLTKPWYTSINSSFIDCSIPILETYGDAPLLLKNSTINLLKFGIVCYEGIVIYNQSGFSGTGKYTNMTTIEDCEITESKLCYYIVNNTAQLLIQNISIILPYLFGLNNAKIELSEAFFEKLYLFDNTTVTCRKTLGIEAHCHGNVQLVLKDASNFAISMWDRSKVHITDSVCSVFINSNATLICSSNSIIETVTIFAASIITYSCAIYDSIVDYINIYGWG